MLAFIDESGDPGFKIEKGSSPIFVTSMVLFDQNSEADRATKAINKLRYDLGVRPEFKFNKCCSDYRDMFFESLSSVSFKCRFLVVDKAIVYSSHLRTTKDSFYGFFIRQMIEHDGGALRDAKIVIDGSGDRAFKKSFCSYLKRQLRPGSASSITLKDSVKDPLIQLADMAAGAVARSFREDRSNSGRWRSALTQQRKIDNIWEFR